MSFRRQPASASAIRLARKLCVENHADAGQRYIWKMIHHLSIPAENTLEVASVLVELLGGSLTRFGPYRDSYIAWAGDKYGTAIEVYPIGTEMFPDTGRGQANFRHNPGASGFVATHATVSVNRSKDDIIALASRKGWRAVELSRGTFDVIEFWIENRVMLELMTPEMTKSYLVATKGDAS